MTDWDMIACLRDLVRRWESSRQVAPEQHAKRTNRTDSPMGQR